MDISTLGIDLSKTTFHVIGFNARGEIVLRRKFSRKQLLQFTVNRQPLLIGMEACGGAHFLGRALQTQGHNARLMPAQFVKAFRKSNKNDYLDAEAIAEAVQRPTMRFVPIKTDDQLDLQALHRVRDRWVARRTAVMNQIRGFLMERGITIRKGPSHLTTQLQSVLEDANSLLSVRLRLLILELKHEWDELEKRIENSNSELQRIAKNDDACHRLMEIPGFGPLVSTALVAAIGNGITFRKAGISLHGSDSFPANTRLAARPNCSASASEETNICDVCSCTELDPWWHRSSEILRAWTVAADLSGEVIAM